MPSPAPIGEPVPTDGALPEGARIGTALSWYFHVPFCRARCGYCDFNTYTAAELGGASRADWADAVVSEVRLARRVLGHRELPAPSLFFGGGTPSLLPPSDLGKVVAAIDAEFGLVPGAEVTVEANPDDLTEEHLAGLRAAGANRLSLGVQSTSPTTLAVLERTHRAAEVPAVVARARAAGFERLSVDLIYGTPGETEREWRSTLETVLALEPDHVSAYCLTIESGTRLGALRRAGKMPPVDPDEAADRYELADEMLAAHGLRWYEISNWARPGQECRHNLVYWRGGDWWGAGPGAHSHIGGVRWWNARHPRAWAGALASGTSPAQAREVLDESQRAMERLMLGLRLAEGFEVDLLAGGRDTAQAWIDQGLATELSPGLLQLTRRGRLLADALVLRALGEGG